MGHRNKAKADQYAVVHRLDDRAHAVLSCMAERISDGDDLIYEWGWPYLAVVALSYDHYDDNVKRSLARVMVRLDVQYHAIKLLRSGRRGQAAVYELLIPGHYGRPGWWRDYL